MDTYSALRHFADSWMLLAMFLFFLYVVVRVFLPKYRGAHEEARQSIFRNETAPAGDGEEA